MKSEPMPPFLKSEAKKAAMTFKGSKGKFDLSASEE